MDQILRFAGPAPERDAGDAEAKEPFPVRLLESESTFYREYPHCLNLYPTVAECMGFLSRELSKHPTVREDWQQVEIRTNVYLLACAISDVVDDYLVGTRYDFSKASALLSVVRPAVRISEILLDVAQKVRGRRLSPLRIWRVRWESALHDFLKPLTAAASLHSMPSADAPNGLASLLVSRLPADLMARRIRVPAAFRSQDLAHFDMLTLGRDFVARFPDRRKAILVVGLRTAGSYFAPLLGAYFKAEGYADVDTVTLRPKTAASPWERQTILECAPRDGFAVIADEPVNTGGTLAKAVQQLQKAGFARNRIVILFPIHPTRRDWQTGSDSVLLAGVTILTLEPERYYKYELLETRAEQRIREYFQARRQTVESVFLGGRAEAFNNRLRELSDEKFHNRLKRVYGVRSRDENGRLETRYVLAKSVGWGWMAYHAFLAGDRLMRFVPPLLGLRDGILFTEWRPQSDAPLPTGDVRAEWLDHAASYIAERVRSLPLGADPTPSLVREGRHRGFEDVVDNLSRAYRLKPAASLKRARIGYEISRLACPATLIDGKMRPVEWIEDGASLLKSDFEHHCLGKTEINVTDPAYDLAETILWWKLSAAEEQRLLSRYIEESGDTEVGKRLFRNKLMAGFRTISQALANLQDARLARRSEEFNSNYIAAWTFLVLHTMRFCAGFCTKPPALTWHAPLVSMDIDGVLETQVFGFPSATWAGMQAVSLLHAHGLAVAINTARSIPEVKDYCQAYGFAGGVAEYGAYVWDAIAAREQVLVDADSLEQLYRLKTALRGIPGVFLNDNYRYSIRAFVYRNGVTVAVPTMLMQNLISSLKLDRLRIHETFLDTAVTARNVDKGVGLRALMTLAGASGMQTVAIGDSEPDLAMFAAADRSYAPSHMSDQHTAKGLGCSFAEHPFQRGLLSIARRIVHPDGGRCERCREAQASLPDGELIVKLLKLADERRSSKLLLRALLDPMAIRAFAC